LSEEIKSLDDVVTALAIERYYWVETKDDEGFWVKAADQINSYFQRDVKMSIRKAARSILMRMPVVPGKAGHNSTRNVNEVLNRLQELNTWKIRDFDADHRVIHFKNCIYFCESAAFLPRNNLTPEQYVQMQNLQDKYNIRTFILIPWDFPYAAFIASMLAAGTPPPTGTAPAVGSLLPDCPKFKRFLEKAIPKQQSLMWDWIACLLIPGVSMKKSVFMIGETDTGKTTLVKILRAVLGRDNCAEETFHGLCDNPFCRGNLEAKLLNYDDDVSGLTIKDPGEFKKITGDDVLRVERKHMNAFYVTNTCKMMFSTNKIPHITNLDTATANRILLFFFGHQFTVDEKDPEFDRSVIDNQAEMQGILVNAMKALPDLLKRKHFESMDIHNVLHYLRMAIEPVYEFLSQCCTGIVDDLKARTGKALPPASDRLWKDYISPSDTIFDEFSTWAAMTGKESKIDTPNKFTGVVRRYGILCSSDRVPKPATVKGERATSVTVRTYHYVKLRENFDGFTDIKSFEEYKAAGYPDKIEDLLPPELQPVAQQIDVGNQMTRALLNVVKGLVAENVGQPVELELIMERAGFAPTNMEKVDVIDLLGKLVNNGSVIESGSTYSMPEHKIKPEEGE